MNAPGPVGDYQQECLACGGSGYDGNREDCCHCQGPLLHPKIDQTVEGISNPRGNCLQAAIATACNMHLSEVIDVTDPAIDPEMWHVALAEWGQRNGLRIASQREWPDEEYCVGIGPTVRENGLHAVAIRNREIYHDPHSSRAGLTRVQYFFAISPIEDTP